jgi:hypothetical protein
LPIDTTLPSPPHLPHHHHHHHHRHPPRDRFPPKSTAKALLRPICPRQPLGCTEEGSERAAARPDAAAAARGGAPGAVRAVEALRQEEVLGPSRIRPVGSDPLR